MNKDFRNSDLKNQKSLFDILKIKNPPLLSDGSPVLEPLSLISIWFFGNLTYQAVVQGSETQGAGALIFWN